MQKDLALIRQLIREIIHEKDEVVVYHASPQLGLERINPKYSPKFFTAGVFVTRDLSSIYRSWAGWALRKPDKTRTGRTGDTYENLAIYTIRIPKKVFDASEEVHEKVAAVGEGDSGAWGWDVETFIPAELMPDGYLTPTSVKTYNARELEDVETRSDAWRKAGMKPPSGQPLPQSGKNPAKAAYADLSKKIPVAALKRGGRLGVPEDWQQSGPRDNPQELLYSLMQRLYDLAKKTRLGADEYSEFEKLKTDIENTLKISTKSPPAPDRFSAPKLGSRSKEKRPHGYRRSPSERRGEEG